jgi:hypothetical protein
VANGNTWTVNNISVTAGAGNDSLVDSPTNGSQTDTGVGGEVRGNYATLNPNMTRDFYITYNFGQRAFAYPLSGFKALCTTNLPTGSITTSGSFTGNANADGPFVYLNGVPTAMTINSNAVTFATHADKLSNGFKLRTSSGSYNTAGSNTYSITTTGAEFKFARAQPNP